jgi:translation initiation factor IF-3
MIRIPQVRVVDEEGAQLGVMPTPRALEMAQERGLDLVEVAPMAAPPVVKFLDFGQYKYDLTKREKEAKRKQRSVTFKEVRLSPKIGTGDFDTKVHRAIEFLEDGDRIKVTVRFRGRELTHPELGRNLIARFVDRVKEHGVAERTPLLEGKSMHITMASLHKPKTHDAPAPRAAEASEPKTEAPPATAADTQPATAAETEPTTAATQPATAAETEPTTADTEPAAATTQPTTVTEPKPKIEPKTEPEPAPLPAEAPVAVDVRPAAAAAPVATRVAETRSETKQSTPAPEPVTSGE